ncbi:MAG TPA: protein phosphatase 2C domain-containing protein [Blastocatellia bacterium]|nr:protein phosphatase 2C domain-containing protein [Blastocatellia bacterium]
MSAEISLLPDVTLQPVKVDFGALSHPGKVRANNEDYYLVASFERSMKALITNLREGDIPHHYADTGYGILVADGMGGAVGGEVASRTAISAIIEMALRTPDWIMRLDEELAKEVLRRMSERIKAAEETLMQKTRIDPGLRGMGTTVTIALSVGANLLIAHVGDSRAYLFREDQLYRLTCDHTFAQDLARIGAISPEAVKSHPMRHVLTNVVSSEGHKAHADLSILKLTDGDQVLLCTDGLTDMVSETEIKQSLAIRRSTNQACHALVEMALEGGGRDNITVVLARYSIAQ